MQKELEELQPQLVETAKENTKMMKVRLSCSNCCLVLATIRDIPALFPHGQTDLMMTILDITKNRYLFEKDNTTV